MMAEQREVAFTWVVGIGPEQVRLNRLVVILDGVIQDIFESDNIRDLLNEQLIWMHNHQFMTDEFRIRLR